MSRDRATCQPSAAIATLDPLSDDRWEEFLRRRPDASVFHTRAWLKALQRAYAFEPVVFTESSPATPLRNGVLFCRVSSAITGQRLVSAPFSDHCDPLVNSADELARLSSFAVDVAARERHRYTEMRPRTAAVEPPFRPASTYYLHELDLTPGAKAIYANFHRDCVQRKIRRSEREKLSFEQGNSADLLKQFYHLHTRTRLRLGLPPQPIAWFEALLAEFAEHAAIRVAHFQGEAVACILTLEFQQTTVYKYGSSDERFNRLGGAQAIMWGAIEEACSKGHTLFDMGRSDLDQSGLIEYKDRWGAKKTLITYYRYPPAAARPGAPSPALSVARKVFSRLPAAMATWLGRRIYRHLA